MKVNASCLMTEMKMQKWCLWGDKERLFNRGKEIDQTHREREKEREREKILRETASLGIEKH